MSDLYLIRDFPYEPETREGVEECNICAALVVTDSIAAHALWHARQGEVEAEPEPTPPIDEWRPAWG